MDMRGFNGEANDDEDDEYSPESDIFDPSYDPSEDFESKVTTKMTYKPEDMDSPQFLRSCAASKVRGGLTNFLGALGIVGEIGVAKVERILDSHFPTLLHQSDVLFEMMEEEYSNMCIGSVTRVGDMTEEGEFVESTENTNRRLQALQMLYKLRMTRLKLREDINKLENFDATGSK